MDDMFKIIGILLVVGFIVYLALNWPSKNTVKPYNSYIEGFTSGSASDHSESFKKKTTQLHDTLLIDKYRSDHENVIMNYDDYVNALMLDTILKTNHDNHEEFEKSVLRLNSLNSVKDALNNVMKFVDKS